MGKNKCDKSKYLVHNDPESIEKLELKLSNGHARQMGFMEDFFAMLQRQKMYKCFFVISKYNKPVYDAQLLFHAIRELILKYPLLALTVVEQDVPTKVKPRPYDFVQIIDDLKYEDVIWDLREDFAGLSETSLLNKLNDIVLPYEEGKLVWRLGVLDDFTLAFITNHVLHDGVSAKYIHEDLATTFTNLPPDNNVIVNIGTTPIFNYETDHKLIGSIPKPINEVLDYTPPLWYLPEFLINMILTTKLCQQSNVIHGDKDIHYKININPKELSQLKKSFADQLKDPNDCKITLSPYIQAAWLYSLHQTQVYKTISQVSSFGIAVDSRQYMTREKEHYRYGLNVSGSCKTFRALKNLGWSQVKYLNTYMKSIVKTHRPLYYMGILGWDKIVKNKHMDVDFPQMSKKSHGTFFSNIGMVNDDDEGYSIVDSIFSQHFNVHLYDFSITTISTKNTGLNIVITSPERVGQDVLDRVCKKFHETLIFGEFK